MWKNVIPYGADAPRKRAIDRRLTMFIARDFQPFNVVADKGFRKLIRKLDRRYKIPSRKTLSEKLIPECYEEAKKKLLWEFEKVDFILLTIDA